MRGLINEDVGKIITIINNNRKIGVNDNLIIGKIVKNKQRKKVLKQARDEDYASYIKRCKNNNRGKARYITDCGGYNLKFICLNHGCKTVNVKNGFSSLGLCCDCTTGVPSNVDNSLINYGSDVSLFIKDKYAALNHRHYIVKGFYSKIISVSRFIELTFSNCKYCNGHSSYIEDSDKVIYNYNGIDRLDSELGYTEDNSKSCCKYCNLMKGSMSYAEFTLRIKNIHNHQKL